MQWEISRSRMRQLFTCAILNLVTIVISSVGFTLSVLAHCLATFLPLANGSVPQIVHTSSLTIVAASMSKDQSSTQTVVSLQLGGAQVNFRAATVTALQRRALKFSMPTETVIDACASQPVSAPVGSQPSPQDDSVNCSSTEHITFSADVSSDEGSPFASHDVATSSRRSSLTNRLPQVFRRRSSTCNAAAGPSSSGSRASSASRDVSPRMQALSLKRELEESTIDAKRRVPIPNNKETLQTSFVNPFKQKRKSPSSSPMPTPHIKTFNLPDSPALATVSFSVSPTPVSAIPPSVSTHRRHRSLASYITSAIRPSSRGLHNSAAGSESDSRSPSPQKRISLSPYSSSSASSSSRSRRSFSFSSISSSAAEGCHHGGPGGVSDRDAMPRTQPYGAPYYAAMPVPTRRPSLPSRTASSSTSGSGTARRPGSASRPQSSSGRMVKPIFEGDEVDSESASGGLGLEFGEVR
ncbi:hypothetical protein BC835DRAFT_90713 [Cytidiella melzeri]|nr:hypothetical protein BC835DRAFT_90713 [Cytidiella melzeri]